jgi:hypothetical protein
MAKAPLEGNPGHLKSKSTADTFGPEGALLGKGARSTMRFRAAFVVLLIVFGLVVLGAIVTTAKYVETHQAEQHPVKAKRAG